MPEPRSGDCCPRLRCKGRLRVYCSRLIGDEWRLRFFECNKCGAKPSPRSSVARARSTEMVPRSTARPPQIRKLRDNGGMDTPDDTTELLNAWEVGQFIGASTENVLALWEDGVIPPPRTVRPLRWHEHDLGAWWAKQEEAKQCNSEA